MTRPPWRAAIATLSVFVASWAFGACGGEDLVNHFATAPYPVLDVPYGYSAGMDPIFAFVDEQLGGGP